MTISRMSVLGLAAAAPGMAALAAAIPVLLWRRYMDLVDRHTEIRRAVEEAPDDPAPPPGRRSRSTCPP